MEFVKVVTSDDLILQGILSEPSKKTDEVILHIHGMSGNFWENSFIKEMLNAYPKNNIAFLTVENRGSEIMRWFKTKSGKEKLIGNAYEVFEECVHDIQAWINFLKEKGYKKIHLQGHSLGCSKIAYYQSIKMDKSVKSLLLISPSDMLGLYINEKDKPEYDMHMKESQDLINDGKGNQLLSRHSWGWATLSANTFVNFFKEKSNTAIFNYYKTSLGFKTINKIDIPMLAITGTEDDGIVADHKKSLELLKKESSSCPKFNYTVFDGAKHSFTGFEKKIVNEVIKFIKS